MIDNVVIKVLSKEHGKKVIEYFKSNGIDTKGMQGNHHEKISRHCHYGLINGVFSNYTIESVLAKGAKFIELPEEEQEVTHETPEYYKKNGIEAIDVIEAYGLGFNLGNVIKYVLRHENKEDALKDLKKAMYYLEREIKTYESKINN